MDVGRVAQREYFLEIPNFAYFYALCQKNRIKNSKSTLMFEIKKIYLLEIFS